MRETFRVLSIDAWADCCGCECDENNQTCWTWNNWFNFGTYDVQELGELNEKNAKAYFQAQLKDGVNFDDKFDIDDDQTNLVMVNKKNRMPVLAIEYRGAES